MIHHRRATWLPIVLLLVVVCHSIRAQADDVKEARTYFNAGAQAYEAGQFLVAIQAFERAYELAPREAIIFTIGQAYRRQYLLDRNPGHLRAAIARYRDYLAKVPEGGRRVDAAEALAELEPIASRLTVEDETDAPAPSEVARQTRIMVTSSTEGARASLDGDSPSKLPLIARVKPGKHQVIVSAPGFFDEQRDLVAADGLLALDIVLRERPGSLEIRTEVDAEVSVDGRLIGVAPLARPVEIAAGDHVVTVMKNGRRAHSTEVRIERGKRHRLDVALATTGQRAASNVLFVTSAAALVSGGVFTVLAMDQQAQAKDLRSQAEDANIALDTLRDYNAKAERRDDYRRGAIISFGASVVVGATGWLLYSFDRPSLRETTGLERIPERTTDKEPSPIEEPMMEISAVPLVGPGHMGAGLMGRF